MKSKISIAIIILFFYIQIQAICSQEQAAQAEQIVTQYDTTMGKTNESLGMVDGELTVLQTFIDSADGDITSVLTVLKGSLSEEQEESNCTITLYETIYETIYEQHETMCEMPIETVYETACESPECAHNESQCDYFVSRIEILIPLIEEVSRRHRQEINYIVSMNESLIQKVLLYESHLDALAEEMCD